ncbi:uncharacterized protein YidB (DUF937 family) [Dyella sp. SG562]|jgi:uncharacterized protein YidB (DUF937 family)|uniref:YidB family protein n=1 Tax=Dyella TaxID=231454 RepID=UPI00141E2EF0|nr:uncharacterized protein YidB (DUF937 family) [Dyella sp. SG562]NKJ22079.1 uncharacterized protein YidB (DUF937 family) [Dyella sp. SG609]
MASLNDLLGGLGSLLGQGGQEGQGGSLISVAGQLIDKAGGLQGLLNILQQHGLGEAAQSWVGTGANQPVSGDQLGQALQNGGLGSIVQEAAGKLGVNPGDLLGQLSQVLPHAVDHLTPDGQVPQGGSGIDLGSLASLAGSLFGGNKAQA